MNGNLRRGRVGRFQVGTAAWRVRGQVALDRKTEKIQGSQKTLGGWFTDPAVGAAVEFVGFIVVSWFAGPRL